ncbi:MAG: HD domain-containing protein [Balneolales bacterium]|nr:HD domain-containing protein [Balneolales bacterium]
MQKDHQYKIFTDPIHGFISVPKGLPLKLLDHPFVQRLRRVRQLGLAYNVFPGAEHSRFSHALGAMGLMIKVLNNLREKNTTITNAEYDGMLAAILLHDIGHGPFSHTLEHTLIRDFHHELMTLALMKELNQQFDGQLDTAIQIFTNQHSKPFLHQLISSQLDVDRMDYIKRDSFYTGVQEGSIGIDRIIKTLRVHQGNIVIDRKGIYAIENYIMARRFMYMQVYLHKTVISADTLLRSLFKRARDLIKEGYKLAFPSLALQYFIEMYPSAKKGIQPDLLSLYTALDDNDVLICIKLWQNDKDPILSDLCQRFLNRNFFRASVSQEPLTKENLETVQKKTSEILRKKRMPFDERSCSYYLETTITQNEAYKYQNDSLYILDHPGTAVEFSRAADARHIEALSKPVLKHYIIHLKEIRPF